MKLIRIAIACLALIAAMSLFNAAFAWGMGSSYPLIGNVALADKYDNEAYKSLVKGDIAAAKSVYTKAILAAPFEENANLGLARCAVAAGDYSGAEHGYESAILSNRNNAQYSVDLLTEYALVLQKENKILKAITYYNQALDYSVSSYALRPMDTYPADFRADGSDYNANAMTAVTHIMRALNTLTNYDQRIPLEREEAIAADPQNPIVLHYENEISGLGKKTEYTYALPDPRPKSDDYLVKINP